MRKIVVSLFDGLSGAYEAIKQIGWNVDYYASEIDKYAIKISQKNNPKIIQLGDIKNINVSQIPRPVFLLIGGSPCQDLSLAKKNRKGLNGNRSSLFFDYISFKNELNPKYFILENVASMATKDKDAISKIIGCEPILINSSLLTAQNRKRLYWTNIPNITQPEDKHIYLKDILDKGVQQIIFDRPIQIGEITKYDITEYIRNVKPNTSAWRNAHKNIKTIFQKSNCLSASGQNKSNCSCTNLKIDNRYRKLTPIECERLQGLPDNYTEGISNTQRYKMIGNGFTIPVIKHILSFIPCEN